MTTRIIIEFTQQEDNERAVDVKCTMENVKPQGKVPVFINHEDTLARMARDVFFRMKDRWSPCASLMKKALTDADVTGDEKVFEAMYESVLAGLVSKCVTKPKHMSVDQFETAVRMVVKLVEASNGRTGEQIAFRSIDVDTL
jgi:hypothetical protein